ncbi:hypothetical protein BDQ12DRAFT_675149 [Crucibulum laeve]|uniref:Uncharacterized protein n=1 Tax=Crucibulum laeve TaxID=68775 RepID=A0A5C3MDR9_9AGAR|nr:hypothetical protein BDQ12DRAFT_675149 [Crucibulum laeve]
MASPTKRLLTEEARTSSFTASQPTSTSDDLTARLRSLGSRVRKNVTEGYATPPSVHAFSKSKSTGYIFRSANDTLRDVYSTKGVSDMPISAKKRSRSASTSDHGNENSAHASEDDEELAMQLDSRNPDASKVSLFLQEQRGAQRPLKPLRRPRKAIMATQSLPSEAFRFSGSSGDQNVTTHTNDAEDDDWSVSTNDQTAFTPMML